MKEMLQINRKECLKTKIDNLPPKQKSTIHAFSILHTALLQATNYIEI